MKKLLLSACAGLLACQAANAIVISGSVGGAPTGVRHLNFDGLLLGSTSPQVALDDLSSPVLVTLAPDAQVVTGSVFPIYAAPFLSGGNGTGFGYPPLNANQANGVDLTPYITSGANAQSASTVTLGFGTPQQYFGLLWGSVDAFNTLQFYSGASLVDTVTGSQVLGAPNGDQGVNGTLYVNINTSGSFDSVKFTSTLHAFEFDNVAYDRQPQQIVPDGGSILAVFGLALAGLASVARRRRSN